MSSVVVGVRAVKIAPSQVLQAPRIAAKATPISSSTWLNRQNRVATNLCGSIRPSAQHTVWACSRESASVSDNGHTANIPTDLLTMSSVIRQLNMATILDADVRGSIRPSAQHTVWACQHMERYMCRELSFMPVLHAVHCLGQYSEQIRVASDLVSAFTMLARR